VFKLEGKDGVVSKGARSKRIWCSCLDRWLGRKKEMRALCVTTRQKRREKESGDYTTQERGRNIQMKGGMIVIGNVFSNVWRWARLDWQGNAHVVVWQQGWVIRRSSAWNLNMRSLAR